MPIMGIEPIDQIANNSDSSVQTTILGRMLISTASYDKYILNVH